MPGGENAAKASGNECNGQKQHHAPNVAGKSAYRTRVTFTALTAAIVQMKESRSSKLLKAYIQVLGRRLRRLQCLEGQGRHTAYV